MGFRPAKVLQKSDYAKIWRLYFSFLSVIFLNENEDNTKKTLFLTIIRSFLLSLQKISCTRQFESKLSLRSLAVSLHKKSCARQFESKLSLRSLAVSLHSAIASKLHTPWTNGHRRVAELKIAGRRVKQSKGQKPIAARPEKAEAHSSTPWKGRSP